MIVKKFKNTLNQTHNKKIFELSNWDDDVWRFVNPTPGTANSNLVIYWTFELCDGSRFVDTQWKDLLETFKYFLVSLWENPYKGPAIKVTSIPFLFRAMKYFIQWMVRNNYHNLSEIDSLACDRYLEYLKETKAKTSDDIEGITASSIIGYIDILCKVYAQSPVLKDKGIPTMPDNPFNGESAYTVAQKIALDIINITPPVPEEAFLPIIMKVLEWLEFQGQDVIKLAEEYLDRAQGTDNSPIVLSSLEKDVIQNFTFSTLPNQNHPWIDASSGMTLVELMEALTGACIIAILAFVGIRSSELCGLKVYPVDLITQLPACIFIESSQSGLDDIFYIKGTLYKGSGPNRDAAWASGLRGKGSNDLPIPIKAVMMLEKLYRHWRKSVKSDNLYLFLDKRKPVSYASRDILLAETTFSKILETQRVFITKWVTLPSTIKDWNLERSHQWRKSFALNMVRIDPNMLPAVSRHFKHVSVIVTEQAYITKDPELFRLIEDEASRKITSVMYEIITDQVLVGGKMAEVIKESKRSIQKRFENLSDEEKKHEIVNLVKSSNVRIYPCEWGWCLFRAGVSQCNKDCNGVDDMAVSPNFATRNPNICCECRNLAVTQEHATYWEQRLHDWKKAYDEHQEAGNVEFAFVAQSKVKQCKAILKMIGKI